MFKTLLNYYGTINYLKFYDRWNQKVFTKEFQVIIEQSFAVVEKKKKQAKDKSKAEKKEPEEIAILDGKRSFSMVVGLKAFQKANMQDNDIRDAMLKLDDTVCWMNILNEMVVVH